MKHLATINLENIDENTIKMAFKVFIDKSCGPFELVNRKYA
jgi:hypothetical protein